MIVIDEPTNPHLHKNTTGMMNLKKKHLQLTELFATCFGFLSKPFSGHNTRVFMSGFVLASSESGNITTVLINTLCQPSQSLIFVLAIRGHI
jgi:hypothetical protein